MLEGGGSGGGTTNRLEEQRNTEGCRDGIGKRETRVLRLECGRWRHRRKHGHGGHGAGVAVLRFGGGRLSVSPVPTGLSGSCGFVVTVVMTPAGIARIGLVWSVVMMGMQGKVPTCGRIPAASRHEAQATRYIPHYRHA